MSICKRLVKLTNASSTSQSSHVKVLSLNDEFRFAFAVKRVIKAKTDSVAVYHIAIRTAGDLSSSVMRGMVTDS